MEAYTWLPVKDMMDNHWPGARIYQVLCISRLIHFLRLITPGIPPMVLGAGSWHGCGCCHDSGRMPGVFLYNKTNATTLWKYFPHGKRVREGEVGVMGEGEVGGC